MTIGARLFAACYDRTMDVVERAGMAERRQQLLTAARGHVLEVGAGTGANLAFYGADVESVTLAEPEEPMLKRLRRRAADFDRVSEIVGAPAERLPFADDSFDTVVSTLVLCTAGDQTSALREIRRVLRPGSALLFIEHVRSDDDARLARRQDRLNRINRVIAHGCNCNRATVDTVRSVGFEITQLDRSDLHKAPSWLRPLVIGTARA